MKIQNPIEFKYRLPKVYNQKVRLGCDSRLCPLNLSNNFADKLVTNSNKHTFENISAEKRSDKNAKRNFGAVNSTNQVQTQRKLKN